VRLAFVPLLKIQRDLYDLPRDMTRFRAYIATMTDPATNDLKYPLVAMNPMGKEHVPALLDQWIALDAEELARRAVDEASQQLKDVPGEFQVGLVISDDLKGGWTNRYTYEFGHRFGSKPFHRRGWLTAMLWTSDSPAVSVPRDEAAMTVFRAAHIERHGYAKTLREMLAQEGYAAANAGCTAPSLDADDLAYTREVMARHLDATDQPTLIACLFGDEAAETLGYPRLGFSPRAGLALALADATDRGSVRL
jgi:hypothetical protein